MFKNKWLIGILAVAIIGIMIYSLRTELPFPEQVEAERKTYKETLLSLEDAPISLESPPLVYYPADETWQLKAQWEAPATATEFALQMTDSTTNKLPLAGVATFERAGQTFKVHIFDEGETYLLPFQDATNGSETYGGGRYINIPKAALVANQIEINFNAAHNFYCAYNEKFICPIPPKENRLPIAVAAGEKNYPSTTK